MAGRKSRNGSGYRTKTKVTPRRRTAPRIQRRSRISRSGLRETRVPSFRDLVAKGVRVLTSFLPGQEVVKPLVDFGLKTFGLAKSVSATRGVHGGDTHNSGDVTVVGLGGVIDIYPKTIFSYCGHFPHIIDGHKVTFSSQFRTVLI